MPPIQKDYSEKKLQQSHEIQIILFGDDCKCGDITKLKTEKSIGYWKMFINFWLGKYLLFTIELHSFFLIMKQMERIHLQGELIHQEKTLKERVSPKTTQTLWFTKEHNQHQVVDNTVSFSSNHVHGMDSKLD